MFGCETARTAKRPFATVDADGTLVGPDEADNCGSVLVDLTSLPTDHPQAMLRGTGPVCLAELADPSLSRVSTGVGPTSHPLDEPCADLG